MASKYICFTCTALPVATGNVKYSVATGKETKENALWCRVGKTRHKNEGNYFSKKCQG